jgi:O-Antigen ligase
MRSSHSLRRTSLPHHTLIALIASVGASLVVGALVTTSRGESIIEVVFAVTLASALILRFGLGSWLAILILGAIDALPGPELETITVPGLHIYVTDALVLVLVLTLLLENSRDGFQCLMNTRTRRVLCAWSGGFLLLWWVTVTRSAVSSNIPVGPAMKYGRDFAFFALLVPLFAATLTRQRVRLVMLVGLTIGIMIAEIAEIVGTVSHRVSSFWVHSARTVEFGHVTRIYVNAQYLEVLGIGLGFGLLLLGRERRLRTTGAALTLLSVTAVALELTRAQYIGNLVGIVAALAVWLTMSRPSRRFGRQRLARIVLVIIAAVALFTFVHPPAAVEKAFGDAAARVETVIPTLLSSKPKKSTVAIRESEASALENVLGERWLFGLGFLDPRFDYFNGLHEGSIRNGDVGVLNAVMTMGVIGAIFLYFPLLFVLIGLVWCAVAGTERPRDSWIAFGVVAWIVSSLTSSVTLVSLFGSPGLTIAALALGIGTTCLTDPYASAAPARRGAASASRHSLVSVTK